MKELSIEEKAKRYDEAINEIRNLRDMLLKKGVINKNGIICDNFDRIFPELAESEDERIRKALRERIIRYDPNNEILIKEEGISQKQFIAWLEKQAEQKPADKVEPKFKTGDWISGYYTNYKVLSVNNDGYLVEDVDGNKINILFENEKFHQLWTIQDAKNGDVLYDGDNTCLFRKKIEDDDAIWVDTYCGTNSDGMFIVNDEDECWCLACDCVPATKEQRDTLMKAMADAGYVWDAEKKELKKIEQNIAWNENDKEIWEEIALRLTSHDAIELDGTEIAPPIDSDVCG